ncbi:MULTISPECIES: hypothetical protein [unclassified Microbacterium]|uniref:hypothetical protein n=1 Tax=Microbacterium sp. Se63.02b TaxID=2709304 RepID=UPI001FCE5A5F|nr:MULTISPECIES: hypothetical protein [unclassified Microbacterium]
MADLAVEDHPSGGLDHASMPQHIADEHGCGGRAQRREGGGQCGRGFRDRLLHQRRDAPERGGGQLRDVHVVGAGDDEGVGVAVDECVEARRDLIHETLRERLLPHLLAGVEGDDPRAGAPAQRLGVLAGDRSEAAQGHTTGLMHGGPSGASELFHSME